MATASVRASGHPDGMPQRAVPTTTSLVRRMNTALVLRTLRDDGPKSRAEIAAATGLSKPTVSDIVTVLLGRRLAAEVAAGDAQIGRASGRGRVCQYV